jgi:hypothetical protein
MLKPNDIVIFKDDEDENPFLVHHVIKRKKVVSLGLRLYPDIESDCYTHWADVTKLKGKALKEGRKRILKLLQ